MSALSIQPYMLSTSTPSSPASEAPALDDGLAARALASARVRWNLSERECQVLAFLAEGEANKEIAARLTCALRTVESHVTGIMQKARCENRARVIAKFWRGQ